MVETLLPAVWDETYCYGMPKPDSAPDPDMPKSWTNKAHGNTLYAHIADIKSAWAWARTGLTLKERRAVFMYHMLDLTQADIASHEECSRPAISTRLYTAIGKMTAHLNGGEFSEDEIQEDAA